MPTTQTSSPHCLSRTLGYREGGFRGIGFVHSPLLATTGYTYEPLLHVSDWYKTLLGAALAGDAPTGRAAAAKALAPILAAGPIDSIDHWASLSTGGKDASIRPEVRASTANYTVVQLATTIAPYHPCTIPHRVPHVKTRH